jgi:hypothetical protein
MEVVRSSEMSVNFYQTTWYNILHDNSFHLCIYLWLYSPLLGLGRFFSFLILYTVGGVSLDGVSARRKAATYTQNNTNTQ